MIERIHVSTRIQKARVDELREAISEVNKQVHKLKRVHIQTQREKERVSMQYLDGISQLETVRSDHKSQIDSKFLSDRAKMNKVCCFFGKFLLFRGKNDAIDGHRSILDSKNLTVRSMIRR